MTDIDVLIVGAGPTGLTLACELAVRGVRLRIVDRARTFFGGSRADGIQPRTMEVFADIGILDPILASGDLGPTLRAYRGDEVVWEGRMSEPTEPTPSVPHPNLWFVPQFRTEEALELAKDSGTLFKAQVMRVLWQYGLADGMYNTVYKSLFGLKPVRGRILHTPRYEPVDTVLDVIKASRAVVVLAHPSVYHSMELARELIAAGRLDGVEIDHPRNTPVDRAELTRLAKENGLIVTGGTDYHGINTVTPRPVGAFSTSDEMIARIGDIAKARKATRKKSE